MPSRVRNKPLSSAEIKSLKKPGRYSDGRGQGLYLDVRVRWNGGLSKTWVQVIRVKGGKTVELGLGSFGSVSLAKARALADSNHKLARAGINPLKERRRLAEAEKPTPLFIVQAEKVYTQDCARWESDSQRRHIRRCLDNYILPKIGNMPVDEIQMEHIDNLVRPIWTMKAVTASDVWVYTQKVFSQSMVDFPDRVKSNPVSDALRQSLGPQNHKPRHLRSVPHSRAGEALAYLVEDAEPRSLPTRLCLRFVMLTGCRHGEARKMEWNELRWKKITNPADWSDPQWDETGQPGDDWEPVYWDELERGSTKTVVWYIPAPHTKKRAPRRVPMSVACLDVLRETR